MTIVSDPVIDGLFAQAMLTPEGRADPYSLYARMRDLGPRARTSFGPLVVTGYDDCLAVLRDPDQLEAWRADPGLGRTAVERAAALGQPGAAQHAVGARTRRPAG